MLWAYRTTYKTTIGSTPYDLVFKLNAILPIEFSVPTLRVEKELHSIGHELFEEVEQLEELNETCLLVVVGMYADSDDANSSMTNM